MDIDKINELDAQSVQGDEAFERFDSLVERVLAVPRKDILKRDAKHKRTAHLRGKKRGPKPKPPVVSPDPAVLEGEA